MKEYYLTIDMAQELCMVENNDIGRKIRKYFIEVEYKIIYERNTKKRKKERSKRKWI